MKATQSSTMPKYRQTKVSEITPLQREIFRQLIEVLEPYSKVLKSRVNIGEQYELWTNHGFRSKSFHPQTRSGFLFAGVLILKKSVGLYLFVLHLDESFGQRISNEILPFWKGGSAFQLDRLLSNVESTKFRDLLCEAMTYYQNSGWVA